MATSSSPPLHESEEFIGKELFILEDIAEVIDNLFFVIDQLAYSKLQNLPKSHDFDQFQSSAKTRESPCIPSSPTGRG